MESPSRGVSAAVSAPCPYSADRLDLLDHAAQAFKPPRQINGELAGLEAEARLPKQACAGLRLGKQEAGGSFGRVTREAGLEGGLEAEEEPLGAESKPIGRPQAQVGQIGGP
jgi:hypothetical protein